MVGAVIVVVVVYVVVVDRCAMNVNLQLEGWLERERGKLDMGGE